MVKRELINKYISDIKYIFISTVHPHVALHPGPHYAIKGSNITLPTCHVTGHPPPFVTWRKSSDQLPQRVVGYNNSNLQILNARKDDSDTYFCSAQNFLGTVEKKTLLIVVTLPRFTVRPPAKVVAFFGSTLSLNCNATGDLKPVISWKREGAPLPVGRNQQIAGLLVIKDVKISDAGKYTCVATSLSAGVLNVESVTHTEVEGELLRACLCKSGPVGSGSQNRIA